MHVTRVPVAFLPIAEELILSWTRLVTLSEIAEKLDVLPSTVSNWKANKANFPLPVALSASVFFYDWEEFQLWHKLNINPKASQAAKLRLTRKANNGRQELGRKEA